MKELSPQVQYNVYWFRRLFLIKIRYNIISSTVFVESKYTQSSSSVFCYHSDSKFLVCCVFIVFKNQFSISTWDLQSRQEKLKTMLIQNFGDPTRVLYGIFVKGLLKFLVGERLRLRSNVELLTRRIKVSELNSWNVRRLTQLSSSEWVWIVQQQVVSVRFSWLNVWRSSSEPS